MGMIIQMFPQSYIDLGEEIQHHPELVERLQNHGANEFELRMCEVAAYCGVVLDGMYLPVELELAAERFVKILRNKRGILEIIS